MEIADDIISDYENDIERVAGTIVHEDSKDPKSRQLIEVSTRTGVCLFSPHTYVVERYAASFMALKTIRLVFRDE